MARRGVEAGNAYVTLGINDKTAAQLKKISARLNKWSKQTAVAAGAIGVPLVAAAKTFASAGDKLQKLSVRTGVAVESLSALKFAAEQSGTDIDQLGQALFRALRRVGNAGTETGPAVRALKELGLSAKELAAQSPEDQLFAMVDALNSVANESRRSQLGFEVFGDNWRQLQPLISSGSAGIKSLMKEAGDLGLVMSTETAESAAALSDAFNRVNKQFQMAVVQVGGALAPALVQLSGSLTPVLKDVVDFAKENGELIITLGKVSAGLAGVSLALKGLALVNPWSAAIAGGIALLSVMDKIGAHQAAEWMAGYDSDADPNKQDASALRATIKRRKDADAAIARTESIVDDIKSGKFEQQQQQARQKQRSSDFKMVAKSFSESLRSGVAAASTAIKQSGRVVGAGLEFAANFGQQQMMAPQLSAFTAGGLGASALGLGATGGPASPIERVADIGERQEDLLIDINFNLERLLNGKPL